MCAQTYGTAASEPLAVVALLAAIPAATLRQKGGSMSRRVLFSIVLLILLGGTALVGQPTRPAR